MTLSITLNGESHHLDHSPMMLTAVLAPLTPEPLGATASGYAVALNGKVVPRQQWDTQPVTDGDALLLIRPIAGG